MAMRHSPNFGFPLTGGTCLLHGVPDLSKVFQPCQAPMSDGSDYNHLQREAYKALLWFIVGLIAYKYILLQKVV